MHLHDCGLVINPYFSFIGATPDTKVCCEGVTGIPGKKKCSYTARDMPINQAAVAVTRFFFTETDGKAELDRRHDCYSQILGQLLVTDAPFCDFFVYTKSDVHTESYLLSWCFEPSQPQRIISGLKTNFSLSPSYCPH